MPEPKRPLKVFLCHSSDDKPEVRNWYKRLVTDGVDAWLDVESLLPGQKWKIEIPKAIRNSDIVLVFLSKDSINKEGFVQKEIKEALDITDEKLEDAIFIIPARLEDCQVPNRLADYQWVDLYNSEGYNKLIQALEVRARTTNATLLPVKISKIDEVKSKAIEFEKISDFSQSLEAYSELKKLEPSYSGIDEKIQELELKVLESQAIQYELKGDFWNARKNWYNIKRIDPLFPRVDIKIRELESEISVKVNREKAAKEKAEREVAKKNTREKAERQAARKVAIAKLLSSAAPFLRVIGVFGSIIILFWTGSWAVPKFIALLPTPKATTTQRVIAPITSTNSPIAPTKTQLPNPTSTKALTSTPKSLPTEIIDAKSVQMVFVPVGRSSMSIGDKIYLDNYYIDKFEVTNALYKACVDVKACDPPAKTLSPKRSSYYSNPEYDNYPVTYVDWDKANTYCEWRGAQLPTEAQWEKAARGTDGRIYPWGNEFDNNNANTILHVTTPVGNYENGKSPYGVYDMAGNVIEWVADWYLESDIVKFSRVPTTGQYHVLRGGSFLNGGGRARSDFRGGAFSWEGPTYEYFPASVGFRCAKSAP